MRSSSSSETTASDVPSQHLFEKGEPLFEEGIASKEMYLVQEGKVGIYKNTPRGRVQVATIGTGNVLGEQSLLGSNAQPATAIALEATRVLIINKLTLEKAMETVPPWLYAMIKMIVNKVQGARKRIDENALRDPERGLVSLIMLLLPRYQRDIRGSPALDEDLVVTEAQYVCRFVETEVRQLLKRLVERTLFSLEKKGEGGGNYLLVKDIEAVKLYKEYLYLQSRQETFKEADISKELIATLSNIAYVAQKSGQETKDGTELYKSELAEDLADHHAAELLEKNLVELAKRNLISIVPAEEGTVLYFKKEKLGRIKKIQEWLPLFQKELDLSKQAGAVAPTNAS